MRTYASSFFISLQQDIDAGQAEAAVIAQFRLEYEGVIVERSGEHPNHTIRMIHANISSPTDHT